MRLPGTFLLGIRHLRSAPLERDHQDIEYPHHTLDGLRPDHDVQGRLSARVGAYDGFVLFEAPDAQTASALLLRLGSRGAVRTQTLQAFDAREMEAILKRAKT